MPQNPAGTPNAPPKPLSPGWIGTALILLTAAMIAFAWYARPGLNWILVALAMTAFIVVLGKGITGRALGFLINELKIMSLSRFQLALWTVIVVSAYFVIAIARVKQGDVANPLVVQIDWQIWALLGISATSLVASPLLANGKKLKQPADEKGAMKLAGKPFGEDAAAVTDNRVGVLYPNQDISEARFTDMFEGEELADASLIDLGKVQMFFFTIVVAVAYSAEVLHMVAVDDLAIDAIALPAIHEGLLALMGISHAGYLGSKGVTHTPSTT